MDQNFKGALECPARYLKLTHTPLFHTALNNRPALVWSFPLPTEGPAPTFVRDSSESVVWDKGGDPKFRCATLSKTLSMEKENGRWQTVKRRDKDGMHEELFFVFALHGAYNRTKNNKNLMDVFSYELKKISHVQESANLAKLPFFLFSFSWLLYRKTSDVKPILTSDRSKFELPNNQGNINKFKSHLKSRDNGTPIRCFMTHRPMQASRVNDWSCISSFVAWQNRIMKS